MILSVPPKTRQLINHYLNLRIGNRLIQCPYYQNVTRKRSKPVFVGKGLPEEIEYEITALYQKHGKDPNRPQPNSLRYTMIMAGLGIDCSGLVVRILDTMLKEKGFNGIKQAIKPSKNLISYFRWLLKTYSNISADTLTNKASCTEIGNMNEALPGDLIRFGKRHVAIIIEVIKEKDLIREISYCHSTSDYHEHYGIRIGKIRITSPDKGLERQKWLEIYRGQNWTKQGYLSSDASDRGLRRLRILANTTS